MSRILILLSCFGALLALGAEVGGTKVAAESSEGKNLSAGMNEENYELVQQASEAGKVLGIFELRPSWTGEIGEVHTENTAELGYQFTSDVKLTYTQWFNTNFFNPKAGPPDQGQGLGIYAQDGFVRTKVNNIWVSGDKTWVFRYENRLFFPTFADRRVAGMITYSRNYLTIAKTVSKFFGTDFSYVPTFFVYNRPGVIRSAGPEANPAAENEVIWNFDFHLTQRIVFSVPLILQVTRYRDFLPTAKYNDRWGWNFWVWPEIDFNLNSNLMLGVAFYTDNLLKDDKSAWTAENAFRKGIGQVILNAKL